MHIRVVHRQALALIAGAATFVPQNALAMGGEGIAEAVVVLAFWVVVWLVACLASLFVKSQDKTIGVAIWIVWFSFPLWLIWVFIEHEYIEPVQRKVNYEIGEEIRKNAGEAFMSLCENHLPAATKIIQTTDSRRPKSIYVDQPDELYGPDISLKLATCISKESGALCNDLGVEFIEWAWLHSPGFSPCKNGENPENSQCLPEYKRYDFAKQKFSVSDIAEPVSNYTVKVDVPKRQAGKNGFGVEEIRRYQVTLLSNQTQQALAKTEILMGWTGGAPCPNPENEIAKMISQVFPKK